MRESGKHELARKHEHGIVAERESGLRSVSEWCGSDDGEILWREHRLLGLPCYLPSSRPRDWILAYGEIRYRVWT